MTSWLATAARLAAAVEGEVDRARYAVSDRFGGGLPPRVVPYRGFGTPERLFVLGRVLRDAPLPVAAERATLWENLLASYRRFETDEVPGALVRLTVGETRADVAADAEGYFQYELRPAVSLPAGSPWRQVRAELVAPVGTGEPVMLPVLVPPPSATFGVISDIDDTVVRTDATQLLRMARTVFLGNARTRLPFAGVAAFYRALQRGRAGTADNPLFYVSSSPWNFYELLVEFFELQGIPLGPLLLRDWGLTPEELLPLGHGPHKLAAIRRVLAAFPSLPFILVGDSGQEDPEIYAEIIREFPQRVLAAYIRNVHPDPRRAGGVRALAGELAKERGTLVLADDTMAAARHAADQGWIDPATVAEIGMERRADESSGASAPSAVP